MAFSNFQVQQVLRAYARQMAEGIRLSVFKPRKRAVDEDEVILSNKSKRSRVNDDIRKDLRVPLKIHENCDPFSTNLKVDELWSCNK